MKILFLTDSLSLPRNDESGDVTWNETYFYQLQKQFPEHEFILNGIGGATIVDLYKQVFYYKVLKADLIFIQCGIVDCAPRAFTRNETKFLTKTGLSRLTKPLVNPLRKHRHHRYTSAKKFDQYLSKMCAELAPSAVYTLGILPASVAYERKLPGITESIKRYNKILESKTRFINNETFPVAGIMSDHHHLNKIGHKHIFEKLAVIIESVDH